MLLPLYVAVLSPFKEQLNSEIHKYLHSHTNTVIARQQLPSLISTAYQSSLTATSIMSGFRKTGIFPFDPEAVKIKPPTLELQATKTTKLQSRKERKDSRSIKVLFQDKVTPFNESAVAKDPPQRRNVKLLFHFLVLQ